MAVTDYSDTQMDPSENLNARRVKLGPSTWIGPVDLSEERARLRALEWEHFDARLLGGTCGATLSGVDLTTELSDAAIAEISAALVEYKVLFFRNQPLTAEQHVAFARRFGDLEVHPFLPGSDQLPELVRFSKSADVGGYENGWHHDVTWRAEPSMAAILHAIDVPPSGGDTLFCDMNAAYHALDEETKELLDGLLVRHDYSQAFGHHLDAEAKARMNEEFPPVDHPAVCAHPVSGRPLLYVNQFFTDQVVGMDKAESDALLDRLCQQAKTIEFQCRFQWEKDSVAMWDNRGVQHYAASDYWPDVRTMERASVKGGRPQPFTRS